MSSRLIIRGSCARRLQSGLPHHSSPRSTPPTTNFPIRSRTPRSSPFVALPAQRQHHHAAMSSSASTTSAPRLNIGNINQNVVAAEYAVRGELAVKSELYRAKLAAGDKDLPFDEVISANIGNPQQLDQKPITFFRQVASLLENPGLLEHEAVLVESLGYKSDVIERARWLLSKCQSVGAYSASSGVPAIKESIAKFLESECPPAAQGQRSCDREEPPANAPQSAMASPLTPPTSISPPAPPPASTPSSTSSARTLTRASSSPSPSTPSTPPPSRSSTPPASPITSTSRAPGALTSLP